MSEYGISVDIGTSRITLHVFDLTKKIFVAETFLDNPQSKFGLDIISRIRVSLEPVDNLSLTNTIRESVNNLILEVLEVNQISANDVTSVVIVGNSVMHHFFFDIPLESLFNEPFIVTNKDAIIKDAVDVGLSLNEDTSCYSPPLVDSFIGNDAIAMIIDANIFGDGSSSLAVDIGTNTEMILSHEDKLWATSAASGPAFEGMTLECGMPASKGAINRVTIDKDTFQPSVDTIGSVSPEGICGTGAISTLASLLDAGLVNREGSINREISSKWLITLGSIRKYLLTVQSQPLGPSTISLSQPDIRLLQHSKASIRAAIEVLFSHSSCQSEMIEKSYITGAFGSNVVHDDIVRIGMYPELPNASVTQTIGGAIRGADQLLLKDTLRDIASEIAQSIRYVDLSTVEEYKMLHVESLFFPDADQ